MNDMERMTGWDRLHRFLATDPRDVGCEQAMELLHLYVDLVAAEKDARGSYPGIAAHLESCGPCSDDFEGLLAAVTESFGTPPPAPGR